MLLNATIQARMEQRGGVANYGQPTGYGTHKWAQTISKCIPTHLSQKELIDDDFATIISCIVASDKTKLTNFAGDKKAHPVYFTINNLPKRLQQHISKQTSILIGYLPVPKFTCEMNKDKRCKAKRNLFHRCLESILQPLADACNSGGIEFPCSNGGVWRIYPVLALYIANYPEQCKVACMKQTHCPICVVQPEARGKLGDSDKWD
jgi:hypothetical protein